MIPAPMPPREPRWTQATTGPSASPIALLFEGVHVVKLTEGGPYSGRAVQFNRKQ